MYQEVVTIAVNEGCFTMLEVINVEDEGKQELPKLVKEKKVDGIILIGRPKNGYIQKIREDSSIPMVCLDFLTISMIVILLFPTVLWNIYVNKLFV